MVRNATGKKDVHDITYELAMGDGRILRTRVSQAAGPDRLRAIGVGARLRDQLDVDEGAFWACVRDQRPPSRGVVLVALLTSKVGLNDAEVAAMTKTEAHLLAASIGCVPRPTPRDGTHSSR